METKVRIGDEFWFGPLACLDAVVRFDVAVDFADLEADVGPVYGMLAISSTLDITFLEML